MSTTTMHFGPEWMRPKQQSISRPQQPPSPPPANPSTSTYSALVSPAPLAQVEAHDEVHPFRYSKDDLLRIYKDGGGRAGLGLEVERWEGVVREHGSDPIGLREMGEAEKKLFTGPLNSDIRRRQSTDYMSSLLTANLGSVGSRLSHNPAAGSPLRDRFGNMKRRNSTADSPNPTLPKKQSLSSLQVPAMSPREVGLPSPRTRVGYTPNFDGVLSGDSRLAKRHASEASQKPGGSATGLGGDGDLNDRKEEIKEEQEEEKVCGGPGQESLPRSQDNRPSASNGMDGSKGAQENTLAGGIAQLSLNTNFPTLVDNVQNHSSVGAPPGLVDPAAIEWSYKDPTGTTQGPFSAELMQKWCDDGYFTPDLPMKRTHIDTTWTTLEQLRRRCASDRIFLAPLQPMPPGLSLRTESPLQYSLPDQTINAPYQPAPVRSLRSATLESYMSTGSNHSESPSSSFGGGRFGDSSPEPNVFGGRAISGQLFSGDPSGSARGSNFQTTPEIPTAFTTRRALYADSPIDGPAGMRSGAVGAYGLPNHVHSPWGASVSTYEVPGPDHDTQEHIGYASQGPGINYNGLRSPQEPIVDSSHTSSIAYAVGPNSGAHTLVGHHPYGGFDLATGTTDRLYSHTTPQMNTQHQPPVSLDALARQGGFAATQNSAPSQQSPWPTTTEVTLQRNIPLDDHRPTTTTITQHAVIPTEPSSWDQSPSVLVPTDASPWVVTTHGAVDSAWGESIEAVSDTDKVHLGDVDSHQQPVDQVITLSEASEEKSDLGIIESTSPISLPPAPQPASGKSRKQKEPKASAAQSPLPPQPEAASPQVSPPKPAWQKEDDVKKTISLREIQEAEAKRAEVKKTIEWDRERAVRSATAVFPEKEDLQSFTTSWGLPTSQAGSRSGSLPAKEPASVSATSVTPPVWSNAPKNVPAKKTMKEILEEEEKRKKVSPQVTVAAALVASGSRRPYAETSVKSSTGPASGGAWTMVGPSGKSNPTISAASPIRSGALNGSAPSRSNGPAPTRPSQQPAIKPVSTSALRVEDVGPSPEFLKWLNDSLKSLNNSVSVEEIMHVLLSFPIEADASIREIISETIYTHSTTMDGRRFADEFVSKRKADASIQAKNGGTSRGLAKPVSIADVVKAAPKTNQPELGFKVVNKKKKGGRS